MIKEYSLMSFQLASFILLLTVYVGYLSIFFIWKVRKDSIKSDVFKKLYRTPLSFMILVVFSVVLCIVGSLANTKTRENAVDVLVDSTVTSVDDSFIYFTYGGRDYKIRTNIFDSIDFISDGSAVYENNKLVIGE